MEPGIIINLAFSNARSLTRPAKIGPARDRTKQVTPTAIIRSLSGRLFNIQLNISKALRPVQPAWNPRGHGRSAASKRCDAMTLPARPESAGKVGAHDLSANNDPIRGQRQHDRVYRSRACVAAEPKPDRHERDEPSDEDVTDHGHPRDPPGLTSGDHPRFEGDRRRHDQDQDRENQPGHKITEALPPAVAGLDAVTVSSSADEPGPSVAMRCVQPGKPVTQGDLLDRDVPAGR